MIDAKELRIGNFVDVINRSQELHVPYGVVNRVGNISFFKVHLYEADTPFAVQEKHMETDIKDLSPIPLTPEWLERLGFEDYTSGTKLYRKLFNYGKVTHRDGHKSWHGIDIPLGSGNSSVELFYGFDVIGKCSSILLPPIEYVHDLQNFWKENARQELEIKKHDTKKA